MAHFVLCRKVVLGINTCARLCSTEPKNACGMVFQASSLSTKLKNLRIGRFFSLVQGEGFEPPKAEPDDLQSPVFDRFTNPAYKFGADRGIRTHDPLFTKQPL